MPGTCTQGQSRRHVPGIIKQLRRKWRKEDEWKNEKPDQATDDDCSGSSSNGAVYPYIYLANAIKIYELDQQKIQIAQEIENEKIRSNQLDEQVKQMGSKNYVENFARKYLGLYYPDETIVIVETQENAAESDGQTVVQ